MPPKAERTMMIPIEAVSRAKTGRPAEMARKPEWRPYRFKRLERLTKSQVALMRNLEWMLPNVRATTEVSESVRVHLEKLLEKSVTLQTEYIHVVTPAKVRQYVGEPTFLAVIAPQPNKTRGLLEVEIGLAHTAIDMLLGGAGEAVELRPLTDIEEGVMMYLLIETMRMLAPALDPSLPKLRVEGMARGFDQAMQLIGEADQLAVVQLKATIENQTGYLRLFIPDGVLAASNPPVDAPVRRARRIANAKVNAHRLAAVKTHLRFEIAQVEIMSSDFAQLREKDVVLVDGLSARPDVGQGGSCTMRLGHGRVGLLNGEVKIAEGGCKVKVTGFKAVPPPLDPRPAEAQELKTPPLQPDPAADELRPAESHDEEPTTYLVGSGSMENQMESADLLNDIPLQLMVELGRVPLTGEDVVALKMGQVFDLNKQAGEPLDLSVNGKVVARGEVVEIDGALGIRIVALAGP